MRPHLEFASPAWSPWTETDKAVIEKVQMRAVSCISGLQGTYEDKCRELGLDTLEERRRKQDLLQTYKICSGKDKVDPELLFTRIGQEPNRQTRFTADPMNIVTKRSRLDIRKNSYAVRASEEWNALSQSTKTSRSVQIFKNAIKTPHNSGREVGRPTR